MTAMLVEASTLVDLAGVRSAWMLEHGTVYDEPQVVEAARLLAGDVVALDGAEWLVEQVGSVRVGRLGEQVRVRLVSLGGESQDAVFVATASVIVVGDVLVREVHDEACGCDDCYEHGSVEWIVFTAGALAKAVRESLVVKR